MLFGLISLPRGRDPHIGVPLILSCSSCITIIGIVVAPLAAVAYVLLVLGCLVLGFTAVAEATGHARSTASAPTRSRIAAPDSAPSW